MKRPTMDRNVEIMQVSPAELLTLPRQSITVRHGEEVTMDPANPHFRDHFRRTVAERFSDLQTLMLIPQRLREDKVLAAMRQDDDDALAISERQFEAKGSSPCACSDEAAAATAPHAHAHAHAPQAASASRRDLGAGLQSAYRRIRATRHKSLARELSDAHGKAVAWDSLETRMTYGMMRRYLEFSKVAIVTIVLQDIEVFSNSTLHLAPTDGLYANNVRIHVDGRIASASSYLKFYCINFSGNLP